MKTEKITDYQELVTVGNGIAEWRIFTSLGAELSRGKGYKAGDKVPGSYVYHYKKKKHGNSYERFV